MPRGFVWNGTLGRMTILYPTQLSLASTLFEALHIENSLERHDEISARMVSWSIQRWRILNWSTSDEFN